MAEAGILTESDRVELINGEIIAMMPLGPWHNSSMSRLTRLLVKLYDDRGIVSAGGSLGFGNHSEPQPDVAVLRPREDFYAERLAGAQDVILLIEVSDSTRDFDLKTKRDLYAREGIKEFWVVDRKIASVHVFRRPSEGIYLETRVYGRDEQIPLPECGPATLSVADTGVLA